MLIGYRRLVGLISLLVAFVPRIASAEAFRFGSGQNGFGEGVTSAKITEGDFSIDVVPAIPGALMTEISSAGLGISTVPIGGEPAGQAGRALFNVIGTGPLSGSGEAVEFSFDRPGIMTGLDFDGLKDELLEYFLLESNSGFALYFFDSSANMPDAEHPVYDEPLTAAVADGVLTGNFLLLREDDGIFDDGIDGLHIPFAAGEQFTLTFGALPPPYSQGASNGARLQGITVTAVPEPTFSALGISAVMAFAFRRRR